MASNAGKCGGIQTSETVSDPEHHEFIKAALNQTETHAGRKYKVVRTSQQVVAGTLYTFFIVFEDDAAEQEYKVTAWSRPWLQDKNEALKLTFDKYDKK